MTDEVHIGFLIFPDMTQLDVTGPAEILSRLPGGVIHMIWKDRAPVPADAGFSINPTTTFDDCPQLDVLCVCGGMGVLPLMEDQDVIGFMQRQAAAARYVASVCSGSLLLGAAGLLEGYRAGCHWAFLEMLPKFGATPVDQRVVRDRNRLTGGGVTAGIDFGLTLVAELAGEEDARMIQLMVEYDPAPPFDSGSPKKAGPDRVAAAKRLIEAAVS
ncbi:MAG: DJ-1/PfpI family protein [Neomegalonema sp.]|nr:DJ-1/PfpI family protein [Neomegalonema sp.]